MNVLHDCVTRNSTAADVIIVQSFQLSHVIYSNCKCRMYQMKWKNESSSQIGNNIYIIQQYCLLHSLGTI